VTMPRAIYLITRPASGRSRRLRCKLPHPGADHVSVLGLGYACPRCGQAPVKAQGGRMRRSADDRAYEADAYCAACKRPLGAILRAEIDTLFGLEEDERVLGGMARVY